MKVLVDTSVWIEHFRHRQPALGRLLTDGLVLIHPFITGELACGNLGNRGVLSDLNALPVALQATHDEVIHLIQSRQLWGRGIGWIDAHLLASALLSASPLWTFDNRLEQAATEVGVERYQAVHKT